VESQDLTYLEWFPLTGMQMYSQPRSDHAKQYIDHIKVYATDVSGQTWAANLGQMAGVARYWRVVEDGFKGGKRRDTAEKFVCQVPVRETFTGVALPVGRHLDERAHLAIGQVTAQVFRFTPRAS
jgi:hypothetical protein